MLVVTVALSGALWPAAAAQRQSIPVPRQPPAPPPQQSVFRAGTELVQLDISVLDRRRRPVRGLREADFTVLEDGRPQPVVAFEAIDVPDVVATSAVWTKDVTPDVTTNEVQDSRLWVLVIDDAVAHFDAQVLKNVKTITRGLVDQIPPSDRMAVVFTRDNRHTQDFTNDKRKLGTAIESFTLGFPPSADTDGGYYWASSIKTLSQAAEFLIAAPDRRRALVYVGVGVPVAPTSAPELLPQARLGDSPVAGIEAQRRLLNDLRAVIEKARLAGVTIYTIDACGLRVDPAALSPDPCKLGLPEVVYQLTVSANTGGRSIMNTNDFEPGIREIVRENNSYYLLGYRPANSRQDGTYRRIEVKVNRPDVDVRTRTGYYAEDAKKTAARFAKGGEPSPIAKALTGILPTPDLPLQVALAPFAVPGKRDVAVAIALGLRPPIGAASGRGGARLTETIDLETRAFTPEGRARGSSRQTATVGLRPGATGEASLEILTRIDLKPGRYSLRLAAHSRSTSTSGSVYADVEVPDFAAAPLSLSGVALNAAPGRFAGPTGALASLLPLVPTSDREFFVSQRVTAFVRVYQGGKAAVRAIALAIRVVEGRNVVMAEEHRTLAPERFGAARAADVEFVLPLARLNRGPHRLTFEVAAGGDEARRDVRIVVR
jgi:VWFA-related protein